MGSALLLRRENCTLLVASTAIVSSEPRSVFVCSAVGAAYQVQIVCFCELRSLLLEKIQEIGTARI